ncbi:TetR/AcrR family transcriptional regulator [Asanoa iriomotensis]|uniref:TetR family transcriptional regulator n=1 Tax=Asanoa iriomotensis TaxID=234613 RepID=A0ABQ4BU77_9ACTN|nr:TetR/AcrR family transcriptional regulator [Asanoa iriomotensis]GIF54080.1 TetR family transcriptional regulator [Asanoa iriomotensis]
MPRAGLTPAVVVDEAARLADEVGLDRLTLAKVASQLGVTLPSLYKHVAGLDGLRRLLALRGIHELTAATTAAAVGRSGTDALRAVSAAYRDYARAHPGPYAAALRAPERGDTEHQAAAEGAVAIFLAMLDGYGLSGERAIDAVRVARSALHGFVAIDAAGGFGLPQSVAASFDQLVEALDRALRTWP